MKKTLFKFLFVISFILTPLLCNGQMFSVGEESERGSNPFAPYIRGGIQLIDFEYKGDPLALDPNGSLGFTGSAAHLAFETGGFNLGVSLGGDFSGIDDRTYFDLSLKFTNPFYLIRTPSFGAGVPVQLGTKVTSVRSDMVNEEFSQTKLSAGAGAIASLFLRDKFSISAQFIPSFGFSTASGGFIGGNVFSMSGKARLNLFNLIFGKNISIGYDYIYDSYDIDEEEYDYDFTAHALTLGISL